MKKIVLLAAFCVLFTTYSHAQGPPPPPPPDPTGGGGGTSAPIDTDVALLLVSTALFGAYKLKRKALVIN